MRGPTLKESAPPDRGQAGHVSSSHLTYTSALTGKQAPRRLTGADLDPLRLRLVDYLQRTGTQLRQRGVRHLGLCPGHDDSNPSFTVYGSRLSVCGCYPCGFTGDVFSVALWLGRASTFPEAVRHVADVLGAVMPEGEPVASFVRPLRSTPKPVAPVVFDAAMIHSARLEWDDRFWGEDSEALRMIQSLGLPRETFAIATHGQSGLGWASGSLCYVYPKGLKWRNPDPDGKPRFRWLTGKATKPWRADWIKPETHTVYLTEGESDCLSLIAAGFEEAPGIVCAAIPSAPGFDASWAPLFKGKRVILCFDDGTAGLLARANAAACLKGHARGILTWRGAAPNA